MSAVYVFVGPTLPVADARAVLDAVYLPPAAQGDVYRVTRERPEAIGIVDGFFDTLPAVWHKEILWALHERIPVFGAASMGALRAAELAAFGMVGIGQVFEQYHSGRLEDDDEVALAHEPAASGYRAFSIPMVNVRATLAAAADAGIIASATRDALVDRVKALFYPDRSYRRLLAEGKDLPPAELEALAAWLPTGRIDAKRDDALAMLRAMKEHLARGEEAPLPRFHFEHTTFWDGLRQSCDDARGDAAALQRDVLDELRLAKAGFDHLRLRAMNRGLARALGERQGQRVDAERLARAMDDFRRARGLVDAASFEAWLAAHDLDLAGLARMVEDDAMLRWAWSPSDLERRVLDEAKVEDAYPELKARAEEKQRILAAAGLAEPSPSDAGLTREELVAWYFREVARAPLKNDLAGWVRDAGFGVDEQLFLRAALREYLFRKLGGGAVVS